MYAGSRWKTFLTRTTELDGQALPNMLLILAKHWLTERKVGFGLSTDFPAASTANYLIDEGRRKSEQP